MSTEKYNCNTCRWIKKNSTEKPCKTCQGSGSNPSIDRPTNWEAK